MKSLRIILLALASLHFASTPQQAAEQTSTKNATNEWIQADAAMTKHLQKINLKKRPAVFTSALVRKYLPDFRVYVRFDEHLSTDSSIFMINRRGEITPLPDEAWTGKGGEKFYRSSSVADFLKRQNIKVQNTKDAVEVARLFEEVQGAPNYIWHMNSSTKDFKNSDTAFLESEFRPSTNWKYSAEKRNDGWTVKVRYVGSPDVSIMQPPVYEMVLAKQQMFHDLRRLEPILLPEVER